MGGSDGIAGGKRLAARDPENDALQCRFCPAGHPAYGSNDFLNAFKDIETRGNAVHEHNVEVTDIVGARQEMLADCHLPRCVIGISEHDAVNILMKTFGGSEALPYPLYSALDAFNDIDHVLCIAVDSTGNGER